MLGAPSQSGNANFSVDRKPMNFRHAAEVRAQQNIMQPTNGTPMQLAGVNTSGRDPAVNDAADLSQFYTNRIGMAFPQVREQVPFINQAPPRPVGISATPSQPMNADYSTDDLAMFNQNNSNDPQQVANQAGRQLNLPGMPTVSPQGDNLPAIDLTPPPPFSDQDLIQNSSQSVEQTEDALRGMIPPGADVQRPPLPPKPTAADYIAGHEGYEDEAYEDSAGVWTIGFGRTTNPDGSPVQQGQTTTREQEMPMFTERVAQDKQHVLDFAAKHGYQWSPQQVDALTSFTYNLGPGGLNQLTKNGTRDNQTILAKLPLYNKAGGEVIRGLQIRRDDEAQMFSGIGSADGWQTNTSGEIVGNPPVPDGFVPTGGGSFGAANASQEPLQSYSNEEINALASQGDPAAGAELERRQAELNARFDAGVANQLDGAVDHGVPLNYDPRTGAFQQGAGYGPIPVPAPTPPAPTNTGRRGAFHTPVDTSILPAPTNPGDRAGVNVQPDAIDPRQAAFQQGAGYGSDPNAPPNPNTIPVDDNITYLKGLSNADLQQVADNPNEYSEIAASILGNRRNASERMQGFEPTSGQGSNVPPKPASEYVPVTRGAFHTPVDTSILTDSDTPMQLSKPSDIDTSILTDSDTPLQFSTSKTPPVTEIPPVTETPKAPVVSAKEFRAAEKKIANAAGIPSDTMTDAERDKLRAAIQANLDKTKPGDIKVPPKEESWFKGVFADAFKGLFGDGEMKQILARGLILFAGGRLTGLSAGQALSFAAKDALNQGEISNQRKLKEEADKKAAIGKRKSTVDTALVKDVNWQASSPEAIEAYQTTGDTTGLVFEKAGAGISVGGEVQSASINAGGIQVVPFKNGANPKDNNHYVEYDFKDGNGLQVMTAAQFRNAAKRHGIHTENWVEGRHSDKAVSDRFLHSINNAVEDFNVNVKSGGTKFALNENDLSQDMFTTYQRLRTNNPRLSGQELEYQLREASKAFINDTRNFQSGNSKIEPGSYEQYANQRLLTHLFAPTGFKELTEGSSVKSLSKFKIRVSNAVVDDSGNRVSPLSKNYDAELKKEIADLQTAFRGLRSSGSINTWIAASEGSGQTPFIYFMNTLLDPSGTPESIEADRLYKEWLNKK